MFLNLLECYLECSCLSTECVARHLEVKVLYLLCRPLWGVSMFQKWTRPSHSLPGENFFFHSGVWGGLVSAGSKVRVSLSISNNSRPLWVAPQASLGPQKSQHQLMWGQHTPTTPSWPSIEARELRAAIHRLNLQRAQCPLARWIVASAAPWLLSLPPWLPEPRRLWNTSPSPQSARCSLDTSPYGSPCL